MDPAAASRGKSFLARAIGPTVSSKCCAWDARSFMFETLSLCKTAVTTCIHASPLILQINLRVQMMSLQVTKASQTSQTMNRPQFHKPLRVQCSNDRKLQGRPSQQLQLYLCKRCNYFNYGILGPFWCWNLRSDDAETKIVRFPYMFWHIHILSPTEWR